MSMSNVKITVWPVSSLSFHVQWTMPTGIMDTRATRALIDAVLRMYEMSDTECVVEVELDSAIVMSFGQQMKLVKRVRKYPMG